MIIPDINLLLYSYDSDSPAHTKAAAWWQSCLSGAEPVALLPVVVFGFLRIATSARAFRNPMTAAEAANHARSWLGQPSVEQLEAPQGHIESVFKLLENLGAGGNLVTDAQIAAMAIAHGAVVHTADMDFMRFDDLRWYNPLTDSGNLSPRSKRKI